jgi:hypothetical protein
MMKAPGIAPPGPCQKWEPLIPATLPLTSDRAGMRTSHDGCWYRCVMTSSTDDTPAGDLVPVQAKVPRGLVDEVRRAAPGRTLSEIIRTAFAAVAGVDPDAYPVPPGGPRRKVAA